MTRADAYKNLLIGRVVVHFLALRNRDVPTFPQLLGSTVPLVKCYYKSTSPDRVMWCGDINAVVPVWNDCTIYDPIFTDENEYEWSVYEQR